MGCTCSSHRNRSYIDKSQHDFEEIYIGNLEQIYLDNQLIAQYGNKQILYSHLFSIKMLEINIKKHLIQANIFHVSLMQKWTIFESSLENYILKNGEQDIIQKIISLLKPVSEEINELEINHIISQWLLIRPSIDFIHKQIDGFDLQNLMKIPEMLNIIARLIYRKTLKNQYEFFEALITEFIQLQFKKQKQNSYQVQIQDLGLIAVNHRLYQQNSFLTEQVNISSQQPWINTLIQQSQIFDFLISQYIKKWISIISEEEENSDQIQKFILIRDKSKVSEFNLSLDIYQGTINMLKECFNLQNKIQLIKLVQASAILENFEQIAGNALMILSELQSIIQKADFQKIRVKNSSMDRIQFYKCNFNQSMLNNVRTSFVQFVECQIEQSNWKNQQRILLKSQLSENKVQFAEQEQIIICTNNDRIVYFQNLYTGKTIKTIQTRFRIECIKQLNLGQILVQSFNKMIFWNIKNCKKIREFKHDHRDHQAGYKCEIFISPDSKVFIQDEAYLGITVLKINELKPIFQIKDEGHIQAIKFSPDSKYVAIVILIQDNWFFETMKISPCGKSVGLKGNKQQFALYDVSDGARVLGLESLNKFCFSPDSLLMSFSQDSAIILWNIKQNKEIYQVHINNKYLLQDANLKFSPDNKNLVVHDVHSIHILRMNDWKFSQIVIDSYQIYKKVKFTKNGQILIFVRKNAIFLWGVQDEQCLQKLEAHSQKITYLELSINANYLVSGTETTSQRNNKIFWNIKNISSMHKQNIPYELKFITFSKNNQILAIVQSDNSIIMRRINDYAIIQNLKLKQQNINFVALSPDLQTFATSCETGDISLWRTEDGALIQIIQRFIKGKTQKIQFTSDGKYLVYQRYEEENGEFLYAWDGSRVVSYTEPFYWQHVFFLGSQEQLFIQTLEHILIWNFRRESIERFESKNTNIFTYNHQKQLLALAQIHTSAIEIFDFQTKQILHSLKESNMEAYQMSFTESGEILAVSSYHNSEIYITFLWNIASLTLFQKIQSQKFIKQILFSPDQQLFAYCDIDGACNLWKNQTDSYGQFFFTPFSTFGSHTKFDIVNCSTEGSNFQSIEGMSLEDIYNK